MRERLSRVRRLRGPIAWYLDDDALLAADQEVFWRRYRRFAYEDLRAIDIWPNRQLGWRVGLEALAGGLLAWLFWALRLHDAASVVALLAAGACGLELRLGPRASTRITTAEGVFRGALAPRWRHAPAILARIEARVAARAGARPSPADAC